MNLPRYRLYLGPLLVAGVFLTSAPNGLASDALVTADKAAHEWMTLRIESAKLETDWRSQRELLESLSTALQERATQLEENRELAKAKTAKDREEIASMVAKNQTAADDLKASEVRLKALCTKLLALRPKLPPRLSEALDMAYRSLASTELPASERMQVAMTVLNRCTQFNRLVSVSEDVLSMEGEAPNKYYEVITWGLSHGYAIDRTTHKAWVGSPGPDHWIWKSKPEAFDAVAKLIAITNDKSEPEFVALPAQVARSSTPSSKN